MNGMFGFKLVGVVSVVTALLIVSTVNEPN